MKEDFESRFESTFLSQEVQDYLEKIDKAAFRDPESPKAAEDAVQMFTLAVFRHGYVKGFQDASRKRGKK
jgi:hypothetical protein